MTALLEARNLTKHFPLVRSVGDVLRRAPPQAVHAVDGVSLALAPGETLGLIGESGSGKTTLGWLLARLLPPTSGQLFWEGTDVSRLAGARLRRWRRNLQVVFQDPVGSLDPRMRVWELVAEPILAQHRLGQLGADGADGGREAGPLTRKKVREQVAEVLPTVGLPADCLDQFPNEFSGGGRQRLGLARALSVSPKMLILDEPTSALDVAVQAQILNRLVQLQRERGIAYLLITHNVGAVRYVADRVAVMYLGKLAEIGPVRELLQRPVHPYTKALLAALPVPDVRRRRTFYRVGGDVPTLIRPPPGCRFASRCPFVIDRCRVEEPLLRVLDGGAPDRLVACHRAEEVADVTAESLRATSAPATTPAPPDGGAAAA